MVKMGVLPGDDRRVGGADGNCIAGAVGAAIVVGVDDGDVG
jgi:hypothetical protein